MREVAIVGAGELGGLTAHALARRHAAQVVRIVDDMGRVAEGKALDITQAGAVERFSTTVVGATDLSAISARASSSSPTASTSFHLRAITASCSSGASMRSRRARASCARMHRTANW